MTATTLPSQTGRVGALTTIRRGLRLSPELRRGLPGTLLLALIATAGRVIIPVAIQQVIDRGITSDGVDMAFVVRMCLLALGAVLVTAGATGWMHLRLARVSETALSGLRIRAFRHIHDLSITTCRAGSTPATWPASSSSTSSRKMMPCASRPTS